ncbi:uncharacterized protein BT62DRAFT_929734 [Guyanagaster necrorhizus]|uniref:RRM domain-containing protein n=1 Tax=Guyanagaster necrorhizus TaxID=856835 RepID=A0A9P7VZH0_9AGAR|nr:uncharacterized protein BT62DRAFT_929734 [Guyanagaster necrorhizus MCA 3950]KAG7448646.1 hypothetical protein BT62DRAFT_929734 [Guyanagaster necrorhizus MCA 3950]
MSYRQSSHTRYNALHSPKQQVLGNSAGHVPPAWRVAGSSGVNASIGKGKQAANHAGSKILLSRLPVDVSEKEVEELFRKTVGPLKDSFVVYNSQGKSKGMAIISFQKLGDAAIARSKYDGKFVDGRRPIKIEIISDDMSPASMTSTTPSLFDRIAGPKPIVNGNVPTVANGVKSPVQNHALPRQVAAAASIAAGLPTPAAGPRRRLKKGPRRLKKQAVSKSLKQLDQEMEDYRAAADVDS